MYYENAQDLYDVSINGVGTSAEEAQEAVEAAKADLEAFEAYISDGSIRAEYSGTITGVGYSSGDMVIKTIYTEREKTDVTESNCIMCGECIKYCPEDNALSLTCAGKKLYTASRKKVMSGYASKKNEVEI